MSELDSKNTSLYLLSESTLLCKVQQEQEKLVTRLSKDRDQEPLFELSELETGSHLDALPQQMHELPPRALK